jgi:hypothetical protein
MWPLIESMAAMDRLSSLFTREYTLFWLGAGCILLALGSIYFGVAPGEGSRTYRAKNPKTFWFSVSIYLLAGVLFWMKFLYSSRF